MDEDFEVSFPYLTASQLFFEDPLENLRLHVLVKRVPPQVCVVLSAFSFCLCLALRYSFPDSQRTLLSSTRFAVLVPNLPSELLWLR
jgi:hypothetical protein